MGKAIKPDDLGDAITRELGLYSKEVNDRIDKAGSRAIKELERITKDTAPYNAKAYHTHYVDCIATKKVTERIGFSRFIWFVKAPCHRLTHLLVHGHETKDGGRTRSDPFLQRALDRVLPDYEEAIKEAVQGD